MVNVRKVTNDLYYVGASDRRLNLFENVYPVPNGASYNSYLLMDDKTVLFDTVDKAVDMQFIENIKHVLGERSLDYIVVNHMEPDHCAVLSTVAALYPQAKMIVNAKTVTMIKQFFDFDIDSKAVVVGDGDTFETGHHTLTFVLAPMVHWPEVMVTYDVTDKILFAADAFGSFGAINGNLFSDEVDYKAELPEMRRYYSNIVGKYGAQVMAVLNKAALLDINMICPLHGIIWKKDDIPFIVDKYSKWATFTPEDKGVVIAYGSIYGNTQNAAEIIASKLADKGIKNIKIYDVSVTHASYIISEAFRASTLVFAAATYNGGIFVNMENLLHDISAHMLANRTIGIVQNGSWGPIAGKKMEDILSALKGMNIIEQKITIKSSLKDNQEADIDAFVEAIAASVM